MFQTKSVLKIKDASVHLFLTHQKPDMGKQVICV